VTTDDVGCALETKSGTVMAKPASIRKKYFSPENDTLI
jgi:hypothetical protein